MSFSLGQGNYGFTTFASKVPLIFLSGATYSLRHFGKAFSGGNSPFSARLGHFLIGVFELPPLIGGCAALLDWFVHGKVSDVDSLPPPAQTTAAGTDNVSRNVLPPYNQSQVDEDKQLQDVLKRSQLEQNIYSSVAADNEIDNRIVRSDIPLTQYIDEDYPLEDDKVDNRKVLKFRARLEAIGTYFNKGTIYRVRGDGNCFFNAAIAGLITKANRDDKLRRTIINRLVEYKYKKIEYVKSEGGESCFNKLEDFEVVLNNLTHPNPDPVDEDRNGPFARVLRYICLCKQADSDSPIEDPISDHVGREASYQAIKFLNEAFNIKAYCAVVEKDSQSSSPEKNGMENFDITPGEPYRVPISSGEEIGYIEIGERLEYESIDCRNPTEESKSSDFVLLLKGGHYTCLAP